MAITAKLLLILIVSLIATAKTKASQPNIINIQFFVQDVIAGPNATVVQVARSLSNYTGTDPIAAMFGNVFVYDDLLTVTPDSNSTAVGRFQGIAASSSLEDYIFTVAGTVVFTSGSYNGSSFTLVGPNPYMSDEVREIPVVGGTGIFRLVKGYVLITPYLLSPEKNVLRFNATLIENQNEHV